MPPARGPAVLALAAVLLAACAGRPSVADLPEGRVAAPAEAQGEATGGGGAVVDNGAVIGPARPAEPRPGPVTAGGADRVHPGVPHTPVEVFRAFEVECAQYAALAGRGDPDQPRVEPDRFAEATLVQELDTDTAVVADGRGTELLVDTWTSTPRLLPADGTGELPDPYRLGCPPDPFVSLQPATSGG